MVWRIDDPQGDEAGKVKYEIVRYTRGKGIDLGCGPKKAFPHFIGVDSCKDTELFGIQIKPDVVCEDATNLDFIEDGDLDFIFSSHLLEHIEDYRAALANWWSKIKVGGHLVLYLPHRDLYPRIGTLGSNPDHKHDFCPLDIQAAMASLPGSWDMVVEQERGEGTEYSFLQVFRKGKQNFSLHTRSGYEPRPAKTACVVRYGGFGDSIQAANILPELKRQGYHVTFMTTPRGHSILEHDPHIDEFYLQDTDQVPNHELSEFWAANARHYDRFINLCESVEGTLLAMPGRANHMWPDNLRREMLGHNYLEFTAKLAGLPYRSDARFYATDAEKAKARDYLAGVKRELAGPMPMGARTPARFNIMWTLSGSSLHKFYPHQDDVIANVLAAIPEAVVILTGDIACQILEAGWEETPRVRRESGSMDVRDTLALAQMVDCVVGPETGVLNAVAFEPVPKVIMLSHSSRENLTKHWVNTETLEPANTACYPCHRLHYSREFCHEDKATGTAICQKDIAPRRVFDAIVQAYKQWTTHQRKAA